MCPKPYGWQSKIYFELGSVQLQTPHIFYSTKQHPFQKLKGFCISKAPVRCHLPVRSNGLLQTPALPTWCHTYNMWTEASYIQHSRSRANASSLESAPPDPRLCTLPPTQPGHPCPALASGPKEHHQNQSPTTHTNCFYMNSW